MMPRSDRPPQAKLRCKHHQRYQGRFTPLASLARTCRIAVGLLFALPPLSAILFVLSLLVASVGPGLRAQTSVEETIVRVFFDDLPTARQIAAGLEPIESKYENGYLVVEVTAEQLQRLQQRGLRTEPVSAQELSTILAPPRVIRSAQAPEQAAAIPRAGISGFSCYRTVEEAPHHTGVGAAGVRVRDPCREELIGGKEGIGPGALEDGRDRSGRIQGSGGGQQGGLCRGTVHGDLGNDNKEHFLVSGAGDELGVSREVSLRAGDQKMCWTEPQALPWLWALHGLFRIGWAARPAHEGRIGGC